MKSNIILEAVIDPCTRKLFGYEVIKLVNRTSPEIGSVLAATDLQRYQYDGESFEIRLPSKK